MCRVDWRLVVQVLPTMLFCLPIAFVPALSPGAYSFLGFDRSLANLVKTAVFNNKTKIKQKIIYKFVLDPRNRELYLPNTADLEVQYVTDACKENTFYTWLKSASLEKSYETFSEAGITEVSHLEDVKEEDAASLGL